MNHILYPSSNGIGYDSLDAFDSITAHLGGQETNVNTHGHAPTVILVGDADGGSPIALRGLTAAPVIPSLNANPLTLAGNVGATLTLPDGVTDFDGSGLLGCSALVSSAGTFPTSILTLNYGLSSLTVNATSFQGPPKGYDFKGTLTDAMQGAFLDLCVAEIPNWDFSTLAVDFTGGEALSVPNLAKVATLLAAGAQITHN